MEAGASTADCIEAGASISSGWLDVDPNQRPGRWLDRDKIADKSKGGAEFHMAGAAPAIDQHRADGRVVRVVFPDQLESVGLGQFHRSFLGVFGFWPGIDDL
jgi:hypothetical protein